jgi:hypothetical protein
MTVVNAGISREIRMRSIDGQTTDPDNEFDELLKKAAPISTPRSEALTVRLAAMASTVSTEQRRIRHRKRGVVAAVVASSMVLTGAGAAFAATTIDWSPIWGNSPTAEWAGWAKAPDAMIKYTLPGGGSCEMRLGEFRYSPDPNRPTRIQADPRSLTAALDYVHHNDVLADADVEGVILQNRSDKNWATDGDGKQVPFGFGTENYNADAEYNLAVKEAVQKANSAFPLRDLVTKASSSAWA